MAQKKARAAKSDTAGAGAAADGAGVPAPADVTAYRNGLVRWYRRHARDLPWRRDSAPYRVWVSEIMLQQTRVDAVLGHYERFLTRFPDVRSLAAASEEDVLEAWSGLGYYRRARNLHAGAKAVCQQHDGEFPRDEREALALPGIGRYTAGAIRSIAYGERAPILDGNVTRVLCRVFAIAGVPSRAPVSTRLWDLAARVVERGDPSVVNQAQMELGALVCTPRDPECGACPLERSCVARAEGRVDELPEAAPKRQTVPIHRAVLLVAHGDHVLLRRRPDGELLPGLWDLPGAFEGNDDVAATTAEDVAATLPFAVQVGERRTTIRHAVTHRRIRLDVHEARLRKGRPGREAEVTTGYDPAEAPAGTDRDGAELRWVQRATVNRKALSSPARKVLGPRADRGGKSA